MALFTTNPQETITVVESAASRIPLAECDLHGQVDVSANTDITLSLSEGALTLPIVTVNGVIVFQRNQPQHGWTVKSRAALGEFIILILSPPVGFAYKSTVTVTVDFEPEAGLNDDGVIFLS